MTADTRAALDAAIAEWMRLRGLSYLTGGAQAAQGARDCVDRAITAHVEAEVTRRLAVAPSVDDALAAYGAAVYDLGYVLHRPDRDAVLRPVKDAAESTLRAALAADRERAAREARPTPDEARRLVSEFGGAHGAMVAHLAGMTGPESGEDVAARTESARTALLRALGVEA